MQNELFKLCICLSVVILLSIGLSSSSSEVPEELQDLKFAIEFREEDEVRRLVTAYPELIHAQYESLLAALPLHFAAEAGSLAIVRILLERGADVHARDMNGTTALHKAAESGHQDLTDLLVEAGGELNAECYVMYPGLRLRPWLSGTPLHVAVNHGHRDVVKRLCEYGANVDISAVYYTDSDIRVLGSPLDAALGQWNDEGSSENSRHTLLSIICYLLQQGVFISDGHNDRITTLFANEHSIQEEREAIGKALEESFHITGMPRELNQLLLTFLSEHLQMPDVLSSNRVQKKRGCLGLLLAWLYVSEEKK